MKGINKMDCFEKFKCKGMCCYDGVYLSEDDIKKINECIDKYPNEFENKDYIEVSDWKDYKGMKKTKAIQLTRYREDYPKHFEQTRCIFQNEETGKYSPEIFASARIPYVTEDGRKMYKAWSEGVQLTHNGKHNDEQSMIIDEI